MSHAIEHEHEDNNHGGKGQAGYYHATDFALPYVSPWSRVVDDSVNAKMLAHMNCSYLGTPGHPPTLLALKQHAQSLAVLIRYLSPSLKTGRIDGGRQGDQEPDQNPRRQLEMGASFDWLANLEKPYDSDDIDHWKPLNALTNEVKWRNDIEETHFHCPLTSLPPRALGDATKNQYYQAYVQKEPVASHHNLVMHANECLERLDHEYSAMGGILALVPPDGEGNNSEELRGVKNSLLGQFLMQVQGMAIRMHDFELEVANMRDALARDAVVPMQSLSEKGPDARSGREIIIDQDRYVLVHANDETWRSLHRAFDNKEGHDAQIAEINREAGLTSERLFKQTAAGLAYAAGVTTMDIKSRIYRLRGSGHSTIFISPDYPEVTSEMEKRPPVVGLVQPRWPERVSSWQTRNESQLAAATAAQREASQLQQAKTNQAMEIDALKHALEAQRYATAAAKDALATVQGQHEQTSDKGQSAGLDIFSEIGHARAAEDEAQRQLSEALQQLEQRPSPDELAEAQAQTNELLDKLEEFHRMVSDPDLRDDEVRQQLATLLAARVVSGRMQEAAAEDDLNDDMLDPPDSYS